MTINMADAFDGLQEQVDLVTYTTTRVDFVPTVTETVVTINAIVQVAQLDQLQFDIVDHSVEYIQVHSQTEMEIGQRIRWNNTEFKIVQRNNYVNYGYFEVICSEVKDRD